LFNYLAPVGFVPVGQNKNNNHDNLFDAVIMPARVCRVHVMNAEIAPMAADLLPSQMT